MLPRPWPNSNQRNLQGFQDSSQRCLHINGTPGHVMILFAVLYISLAPLFKLIEPSIHLSVIRIR